MIHQLQEDKENFKEDQVQLTIEEDQKKVNSGGI
jgi:hypothetical protein